MYYIELATGLRRGELLGLKWTDIDWKTASSRYGDRWQSRKYIFSLSDIQTAVFEFNEKLSILPVSKKRQANPEDLNLSPAPEFIHTEVIMDGRILDENLKRMGLDDK